MEIKRFKIHTHITCQLCKISGFVWRGLNESNVFSYKCHRCNQTWIPNKEYSIHKLKMPFGICLCVFYGPWESSEIKTIELSKFSTKDLDEFGWYKGRHFYSFWSLLGGRSYKYNFARKLPDLLEKAKDVCKPVQ